MESSPQPVLTYASPINAKTADVPAAMDLTFERPSVAGETTLLGVALAVSLLASLSLVCFTLLELLEDEPQSDHMAFLIANGIGCAVIFFITLRLTRSMVRLLRFGAAPVQILLEEGNITISDPVRLRRGPRALPLTELRRCKAERMSGRYAIVFTRRRWPRRIRVDVAMYDRGIVERAAADLQRAIDRANGKN
jgi:hypothetical protein